METRRGTTTTTTPGSGNPGDPGYNPGSSSSATDDGVRCIPCTNFTCSPAKTTLSYTGNEDLTGDSDCPHPTLFAIDTESFKIAFSYDQFSSQLPNGVLDFEVSFDGVTYADAWDATKKAVLITHQVKILGQILVMVMLDLLILKFLTLNDGINAVNLRIKFRIESI